MASMTPSSTGRAEVRDDGLFFRLGDRHEGAVLPWAEIVQVRVEAEQFHVDDVAVTFPLTRRVVVDLVSGHFVELIHPMPGLEGALGELHRHLDVVVDDPARLLRTLSPEVEAALIARPTPAGAAGPH